MLKYLLRTVIWVVPTLWIVTTATFLLIRLAPGGPFDQERIWPKEIQENILRKYGLDLPIQEQYLSFLQDLSRGDLRESFQYLGTPVNEIISNALPYSLLLGGTALALAMILGIPIGCIAAWGRQYPRQSGSYFHWLDSVLMFIAVLGISLPSFLSASLLILLFSFGLDWFPPALWESPSAIVLPMLTLSLRPLAIIARLTRTSMIEVLGADYIRTAYAKGLAPHVVVFEHALKNSIIPTLTLLGPLAASLVTGSFLVETVFQIPGLGKHFISAVLNRDYPLVMGTTLVYGGILITCNLVIDLLYGWLDPRIRLNEGPRK